jgi:L-ascorbate metabolism protein UlaG (beta-lactamase superfamily)
MKIKRFKDNEFLLSGSDCSLGINFLGDEVDAVLFSSFQANKDSLGKDKIIFDWPGEFEVRGVNVTCLRNEAGEENLVYSLEFDGIRFCFLGNFKGELTDEIIEEIAETDVLAVKIGGESELNAKKTHELIERIEPRIVMPIFADATSRSDFSKEMSITELESVESFEIKSRSALPESTTEYVILGEQ